MDQISPSSINSSVSIPEFQQPSASPAPVRGNKKFRFEDIYLIASSCLFVISLGFLIRTQSFTANSDAKIISQPSVRPTAAVTHNKNYPTSYKTEKIPQTIYQNLEKYSDIPAAGKDEYVKTQVIKFYVYKDILEENSDQKGSHLVPVSYQDITDGIAAMEPLIKENLLSQAFFGYIRATFSGTTDESMLKTRFGDLNAKAKSLIKRYQQLFVAGSYTPMQIVDISNRDEELLLLNNREQNKIIDNYDSTKNVFTDDGFNTFLFSQQANQLSDVYTLLDEKGTPYAYVIVYPTKIITKKYSSLHQIVKERESNFKY